jgi:hypothetical protein
MLISNGKTTDLLAAQTQPKKNNAVNPDALKGSIISYN